MGRELSSFQREVLSNQRQILLAVAFIINSMSGVVGAETVADLCIARAAQCSEEFDPLDGVS